MKNPDKYPQLTIRVSGYAVNFVRLTPGAAAGRDQPHLPRPDLSRDERDVAARHARGRQPPRPARREVARRAGRQAMCRTKTGHLSAMCIPTRRRRAMTGPAFGAVLFMSGCLLRCTYCHNPDTWHLKDGTYVSRRSR